MNPIQQVQDAFSDYLKTTFAYDQAPEFQLNTDESKQQFGDMSSNTALILSKRLERIPRSIAQEIVEQFTHEFIEKIEIAGPGFLNFFFTSAAWHIIAAQLFIEKNSFFKSSQHVNHSIDIEFVSANPTGPLHFGHGRGGIIGDVLTRIFRFLGYTVTAEFYINDAGRQIQKLGESLKARYLQLEGVDIAVPEDGYHGEYLIALAQQMAREHGAALLDQPNDFFAEYAKSNLLSRIRATLKTYGIEYDVWFSEKTLHDSGAIIRALNDLESKGYIYKQDDALWFKSTAFGDDKDRVVRKASGELTYAAPDIAYLKDKVERGHDQIILILGHDHHSYATRLQAICQALGLTHTRLDVILYQLVQIKEGGEQVRMSKRAGTGVTLDDIIETVGTDVARFFYLNRKADAQLEFDLDLALKRTEENPVFYIQYAYVRTGSILAKALLEDALQNITEKDAYHITAEESGLLKKICALKDILDSISTNHHTHLLAYYTYELAQTFSKYYAKHRIIDTQEMMKSRARLLLTANVRTTLSLCLDLMGISKPTQM
jgi:arginyl-tRNA synthetase